jgi:hypothetical protein
MRLCIIVTTVVIIIVITDANISAVEKKARTQCSGLFFVCLAMFRGSPLR